MSSDRDAAPLVAVARAVAAEAGALVHDGAVGVRQAFTKSSDTDPVTAVDLASEDLIRRRLAQLRPDDGILGEEGDDTPSRSGLTWVVDPIDGTVNFLRGLDHYAVSVAVVAGPPREPRGWEVLAGCVVAPALRRSWWAHAGGGAWRSSDGGAPEPLRVRDRALAGALLATGFAYTAPARARQAATFSGIITGIADIRRAGSAAIDLCAVAGGEIDGYYESGINAWDVAAGALIVTEAGGAIDPPAGPMPSPEPFLAGGARLVTELRNTLVANES